MAKKKSTKKSAKKSKKSTKKKSVKKKSTKKKPAKKVEKEVTQTPDIGIARDTIPHQTKPQLQRNDHLWSILFIAGLVLIVVLVIVLVPLGQEQANVQEPQSTIRGPHIQLSVDNRDASLGDQLKLTITGNKMNNLAGYQLSVMYNPETLKYESTTNGQYFSSNSGRFCISPKLKGNTITNIGCVKLPETPGQLSGVSGDGTLATLTFTVIGRGDTGLKLTDVVLPTATKEKLDYILVPFTPITIK